MTTEKTTEHQSIYNIGSLIGILVILFLIVPHIIWITSGTFPTEIQQGVYFIYLSAIFIASYYFYNRIFVFRWIIWLFENLHAPRGRFNAFIYAGVCAGVAIWRFIRAFVG